MASYALSVAQLKQILKQKRFLTQGGKAELIQLQTADPIGERMNELTHYNSGEEDAEEMPTERSEDGVENVQCKNRQIKSNIERLR